MGTAGGGNWAGEADVDLETCLAALPVVATARQRLASAARRGASTAQLAATVESDVGLTLRVLALANRRAGGDIGSVVEAAGALPPNTIAALADTVPEFDLLDPRPPWGSLPEQLRLHALGVSEVAERIARLLDPPLTDRIVAVALLHDIGKVALERARRVPGRRSAGTPEQRLDAERRAFGTDHARLGADLVTCHGLPESVAVAIAEHHGGSGRMGAMVRLADLVHHYRVQGAVDLDVLARVAESLGLTRRDLSCLLYDLTEPVFDTPRAADSCPLSDRELDVMRCLMLGMVPKQIAPALGLSTSTVRNHLHRIYTRLGVSHRTQAVMLVAERGWLPPTAAGERAPLALTTAS